MVLLWHKNTLKMLNIFPYLVYINKNNFFYEIYKQKMDNDINDFFNGINEK